MLLNMLLLLVYDSMYVELHHGDGQSGDGLPPPGMWTARATCRALPSPAHIHQKNPENTVEHINEKHQRSNLSCPIVIL
jgi:hypothetical protein